MKLQAGRLGQYVTETKHANRSPVTRPVLVNYWRFINCATTKRYIPKHINKGETEMTENNNEIKKKRRDFADWAENAVVSLCDETNVSHRQLATLFREFNFDWQSIENNDYASVFAVQLVEMLQLS